MRGHSCPQPKGDGDGVTTLRLTRRGGSGPDGTTPWKRHPSRGRRVHSTPRRLPPPFRVKDEARDPHPWVPAEPSSATRPGTTDCVT
jgi:hypothetical protein